MQSQSPSNIDKIVPQGMDSAARNKLSNKRRQRKIIKSYYGMNNKNIK